ncbi:MAG: S66 peptidase family protein [Thermodesulforhabdaceae bacterium]
MKERGDNLNRHRLPVGSTIALVAPAGVFDAEAFEAARERLQASGYRIVYSDRIWQKRGDVCGTEWERATDIIEFMKSGNVNALWCIRGGYGSSQILRWFPNLPWHKKPLIGYSDISFLHFFIHSASEAVTFHGPNFIELATLSDEHFNKLVETLQGRKDFTWSFEPSQVIRHGTAEGKLLGGNLTCLTHIIGTEYFSVDCLNGSILFVEDVNERPYRIDRMFVHLRDAGVLKRIGALILGHFTNCGNNHDEVIERILRVCRHFNFPIVEGFPAGHENSNECIPLGIRVSVDTRRGNLSQQ